MITADFGGMISSLSTAGETLSSSSWQDAFYLTKLARQKYTHYVVSKSLLMTAPTKLVLHGLIFSCVQVIQNQKGSHSSPASHREVEEDKDHHFPSFSVPHLSILEAFANRMKGCRNQNKVKSSLGFTAISLKVPTE